MDVGMILDDEFDLSNVASDQTSDYSSATESRRRSGVILLAQRLIGGASQEQEQTSPISSG